MKYTLKSRERNSIYKLSCICDIVRVKEIIWVTPYILKIDSRKLI